MEVHVPKLAGSRYVAIQLNAATWESATEVDYFLTNAKEQLVSATWVATTYSQRNWVEVFYREALMLVGVERVSGPGCYQFAASLDFGIHRLHLYPLASVDSRIPQTLGS